MQLESVMANTTASHGAEELLRPSMLIPQTNIQFYSWAHFWGYSPDELLYFNNVYRLSQKLFGSLFRASGKPFISHLLGTAAAVCMERPPAYVVAATLCHLPLNNGVFRPLSSRATKRRQVESVLGAQAMKIDKIYEYIQRYKASTFERLQSESWQPSEDERFALLIFAANEIDDELDGGAHFANPKRRNPKGEEWVMALTKQFQWNELASMACEVYRRSEDFVWADGLASKDTSAYSINYLTGRYPLATRIHWKIDQLASFLKIEKR
jgi:hypothetical protein